jgi:tetratricopeptide (TPR) repeat protein
MNTSTSYINDINSRAVLLLQQNRHNEAIRCLRRGLKFLLTHVVNTNSKPLTYEAQQQSVQTHHSSLKCVDSMDIEGDERLACGVVIPEVRDIIMSVSPDNVFVVFNRAFNLPHHSMLKSSADTTKASATLLYNMGMAWQHLGAQENNTAALKRALRADEMATMAYTELCQQCNDSFSCLVMLALANNMAHIHSHFFNMQEARQCRDLIPQILGCGSFGSSSVAPDDYAFFFAEATLFGDRDFKFAPVA